MQPIAVKSLGPFFCLTLFAVFCHVNLNIFAIAFLLMLSSEVLVCAV